jgi:adenylate cyclase
MVGREAETRAIADFLGHLGRGSETVLLFAGEAGVGKTRLLREVETKAAHLGMSVLSVDCGARDRGVARGPWIEMVRHYLDTTPRETAYRTIAPHLRALAVLAPELNDQVWLYDPTEPPVGEQREPSPEAVARFFVTIAKERPLLISMDDLGSADPSSLELLETMTRVARKAHLGVVGTYRDTQPKENQPLHRLLTSLEARKSCTTSIVHPLDRGRLDELIAEALPGVDVPPALRGAMFEKSKGNPFYATEILRWMAERGNAPATSASGPGTLPSEIDLPGTVERAVEARLGRTPRTSLHVPSRLKRIAILPFANISPDPTDAYFADGLTEELISVVSQVQGLQVIARTSVLPYKSASKGVLQIGAELGVSSVMEGSVRKVGNRLRITVQLIEVDTQEHVWARTYDRDLDDALAIQSEIAREVADELKVGLRQADAARLASRPVVRPESYLAYLKGRTLMHGSSRASLEEAKEQFERAISLDPTNAAACSGLSVAIMQLGFWYSHVPRWEWEQTRRRWATRAIELDPMLSEAHASLAEVYWSDHKHAEAEAEFKVALALNPADSFLHNHYALLLSDLGRADEAFREFTLAEGADPLWATNLRWLAHMYIWRGQLEEALARIQKLGEVAPDSEAYHLSSARYFLARSDLPSCLQELAQLEAVAGDPRRKPIFRALRYALSGRKDEARALLRPEWTVPDSQSHPSGWYIVWTYCELGDLDECLRWLLDKDVAFQSVRLDPRMEPLRNDPRFQAVLDVWNLR